MKHNSIVNCLNKGHLPLVNIALPMAKNPSNINWDTVMEQAQIISVGRDSQNNIREISVKTPIYGKIAKNISMLNVLLSRCNVCGKNYSLTLNSKL